MTLDELMREKKAMLLGVLGAIAIPLAVDSCSKLEENYPWFWKQKAGVERKVDYKEQIADDLNATLRHWRSTPSYEVAKKWLVGYEAPELPNSFAYFVVRETGLVGPSRIKIEDQGSNGIRIELDYAYAQDVLKEASRRDAQRYLNTGNFGGFP